MKDREHGLDRANWFHDPAKRLCINSLYCESANGSLNQLEFIFMVPHYSDNRNKATANTCVTPDLRRDVIIRFKADRRSNWALHGNGQMQS